MKLKDLLNGSEVNITYRTNGPTGEDILSGFCRWNGSKLISEDGDIYYLDDEIDRHEWASENDLVVWYKSRWITG